MCYSQSPLPRRAHDISLLWPNLDRTGFSFVSHPALEMALAVHSATSVNRGLIPLYFRFDGCFDSELQYAIALSLI